MLSSSMAERMPPWMKPAGLQKSVLPSKPTFSQPSHGRASSSRQPSSLADGGAGISSSTVFTIERCDRYPAHVFRRAGPRRHMRGIDHELERKMREDVGDDAHLAVPMRHAAEPGRLLARGLVVLRGAPVRTRHFGHAAKQSFFGAAANQKLVTACHDKGSTSTQVA